MADCEKSLVTEAPPDTRSPGDSQEEEIGREAGSELARALASGGCVDEWLQDQLIIFMALADGVSRMTTCEPTLHTRTAIAVAEAVTQARFSVRELRCGAWEIEARGIGFSR